MLNGLWVNDKNYNKRVLLVFIALVILMAFSPFGYVIFPNISISTLYLGVLAAALWGGPFAGAVVGLIFGLTSMWKASVTAVNPNDLIFSPIRSGNPFGSVILAIGPRVLFGIIAGCVYYLIMKKCRRKAALPLVIAASVLLERVQSSLTYLFMEKVFQVKGVSMGKAWTNLLSKNRIIYYCATMIVMLCAYLLYEKYFSKKYYRQFKKIEENNLNIRSRYLILRIVTILIIIVTAMHLWDRIRIILFDINQFPAENTNIDLIAQVIFQFFAASFAALYIVFVIYRHARNLDEIERTSALVQLEMEKERSGEIQRESMEDYLTGVFNRKGLKTLVQEEGLDEKPVEILLIDVDNFKHYNDTFGHKTGDRVLVEAANCLTSCFGKRAVFRWGGDEFLVITANKDIDAVINSSTEQKNILTRQLKELNQKISSVKIKNTGFSLSIGACFLQNGYSEKWYQIADGALYETKNNGKGGCTLADENGNVIEEWKYEMFKNRSEQ